MSLTRGTRRLPLVPPQHQLSGAAPLAFERACHLTQQHSPDHRGLCSIAHAIAWRSVLRCVAPGARQAAKEASRVFWEWVSGATAIEQGRARSQLFAATEAAEQGSINAIVASIAKEQGQETTPLDIHAHGVVLRYVGLAAYYAHASLVAVLDGTEEPKALTAAISAAAAALAYQSAGLRVARSPSLRARAWEQAGFEVKRRGSAKVHSQDSLALQIFHEYLGAHWKDASDAERSYSIDFISWAMPKHLASS